MVQYYGYLLRLKSIGIFYAIEGDSPVYINLIQRLVLLRIYCTSESGCLRLQPKMRGKSHVTLNIDEKPIENK